MAAKILFDLPTLPTFSPWILSQATKSSNFLDKMMKVVTRWSFCAYFSQLSPTGIVRNVQKSCFHSQVLSESSTGGVFFMSRPPPDVTRVVYQGQEVTDEKWCQLGLLLGQSRRQHDCNWLRVVTQVPTAGDASTGGCAICRIDIGDGDIGRISTTEIPEDGSWWFGDVHTAPPGSTLLNISRSWISS